MATRSNYAAQKLAEAIHEGASITFPATLYFALVTVTPTESMTGTTITQSTATGYARIAMTCNATNFDYNTGTGVEANLVAIVWSALTKAGGPPGETIVGWAACDASSAGNVWYFGTFASPIYITTNPTTPSIPIGSYQVDYTP